MSRRPSTSKIVVLPWSLDELTEEINKRYDFDTGFGSLVRDYRLGTDRATQFASGSPYRNRLDALTEKAMPRGGGMVISGGTALIRRHQPAYSQWKLHSAKVKERDEQLWEASRVPSVELGIKSAETKAFHEPPLTRGDAATVIAARAAVDAHVARAEAALKPARQRLHDMMPGVEAEMGWVDRAPRRTTDGWTIGWSFGRKFSAKVCEVAAEQRGVDLAEVKTLVTIPARMFYVLRPYDDVEGVLDEIDEIEGDF